MALLGLHDDPEVKVDREIMRSNMHDGGNLAASTLSDTHSEVVEMIAALFSKVPSRTLSPTTSAKFEHSDPFSTGRPSNSTLPTRVQSILYHYYANSMQNEFLRPVGPSRSPWQGAGGKLAQAWIKFQDCARP